MELYPEDLDHPFRRGELSTLGMGWRQLAGPLWRSPYRNVHTWSATDPAEPRQRALDVAPVLPPGAALGTWAAASLGGAVELDGRGRSGVVEEPVVVCASPGRRVRRGARIRSIQSPLLAGDVVFVDGIPVTSPVRTAFDLARTSTFDEGVVALDYLARGHPEFLAEVLAYADARKGWSGVAKVRRAGRLATYRSRSAGETRFRLLWQFEARLGAPQVNASVLDASGHLLGIADLLDDGLGLLGEYDGSLHRDSQRHADDNAREEWLEDAGLIVVRAGAPDLTSSRSRTVKRLQVAARRASQSRTSRWQWAPGPLPDATPHWGGYDGGAA